MKKISMLGLVAGLAIMATSCSKDGESASQEFPEGKIPVTFSMKTSGLMVNAMTKAPSTNYTADGFRIFAFKQSDDQWLFLDEVELRNPVYTDNGDGSGGVLTGIAAMDEGVYRFIPTYGLDATGAGFTIGEFAADQAWDDANPVLISHTAGAVPEFFTLESNFAGISDYTVSVGGNNPDYTATINRAVARVDVLIVRATGNQQEYTEVAKEASVFGNKTLVSATMAFTGVNSSMNYFGALPTTASTFDLTYTIGADGDAAVSDDVLIGNSVTPIYGTAGYQGYNAVAAADVLQGAAQMYGPFLIPNADETPVQSAVLTFTDNEGTDRIITLNDASIPLERNYVTIIKIYLLENGDGTDPEDIWSENVSFAVTLDTEYAGYHDVTGGTIGGQPATQP